MQRLDAAQRFAKICDSGFPRNALTVRYSDHLIETGIDASVGKVWDCYYNAMAETIIGIFKTEVIHMHNLGPWKSVGQLE